MKIVCAWCHKILKEYESHRNIISHGICPECLRGFYLGGTDINLRDILDKLDFPVLLTDGTVVVQRANRMAEIAFRQPSARLTNVTVGAAIECLNAQGSGAMRQDGAMRGMRPAADRDTDTHADGQPRYGMYSQNQVMTPLGATPKRFPLFHHPGRNAVMLSIEEVLDLSAAS